MVIRTLQSSGLVELRAAMDRARSTVLDCGLAYAEVDEILDLAPGVFRAMCAGAPSDGAAEGRLRVLVDALDCAARLLGGRAYVAGWLRAPHPLMADLPPAAFLKEQPAVLRELRDALRREARDADLCGAES